MIPMWTKPRRQNMRPFILGLLLMAVAPLSGCIAATPALMTWTSATFSSPLRPPAWIRGEWQDKTGIVTYSFTADDVLTQAKLGNTSTSSSLKDLNALQVQGSSFRIWDEVTEDSYTIHYDYTAGANTSAKMHYSFRRINPEQISLDMGNPFAAIAPGIDTSVTLWKQ